MIDKERDINVIAEASDGNEALALVEKFLPDVVVMDIIMPKLDGIKATEKLLSQLPTIKIVALSMYSDKRFVDKMIHLGALGYVLKENMVKELIKAIRSAFNNHVYLSEML